jgi:ArsR family transcriptional regulator
LEVVEENGARTGGGEAIPRERVEPIVALGRALSDPIRVRMLGMMADAAASGRGCCDLPDLGVPAEDGDAGICVCEFEDRFGMGQSKVSYHMRKLKEAGLVREEKRGRWSFYSLDGEAARELLGGLSEHLGTRAG